MWEFNAMASEIVGKEELNSREGGSAENGGVGRGVKNMDL